MGKDQHIKHQGFRTFLRVSASIIAFLYILFVINEFFNPYLGIIWTSALGIVMAFILLLIFGSGFYLIWKNELLGGVILTGWYLYLVAIVFQVWGYGMLALILGFPVFIIGILLMVYYQNAFHPVN